MALDDIPGDSFLLVSRLLVRGRFLSRFDPLEQRIIALLYDGASHLVVGLHHGVGDDLLLLGLIALAMATGASRKVKRVFILEVAVSLSIGRGQAFINLHVSP